MAQSKESVKKPKKVYRNVRKFRKTDAIQRYIEEQIYALDLRDQNLKPGQKGYVEGEDTPNPEYLVDLSAKERMQCIGHLKSLLPIREAEQSVEELEASLMQLLQLIEQRAPFLLPGKGGGFGGPTRH